ncbi:TPA: ATP-binding protein [Escherichia coli]|uniref:HAMP domain-containing histidine kinase n=1 Tax=Escherichia marmotae TaxID=1499973 RepID=A0A7L5X8A3_9ESCH|nr:MULTISPECIES: ATP-binding protein [Escherichia]EGK3325872.1 HAMP domain-containing histidine kinase [Escherichia coli]ELE43293.1 hypothetical protein A1U5_02799 [Escherichia coli KTE66]QLP27894.1 HAMP domain-containing histidine kinase [Escherichia marmotae]HAV8466317.1 HAMP domain-containing histidine kinase [Escherichia coli]HAX4979352.1 HAMP domain-containing histidine kinase [Escherichia coli]
MVDNLNAALEMLTSNDANQRFYAARYFIENNTPTVRQQLINQRRKELVRHVRMALDKALNNMLPQAKIDTDVDDSTDKARVRYLKLEAIDEFSGTILHELAPKIGLLDRHLSTELDDYENCNAKRVIDSLHRIFSAIESLRRTASKPESNEFDLAQLIKDVLAEENGENIRFIFEGVQPCIIKSDRNILGLALANGIRNAIESINSHNHDERDLTVCWGENNVDNWVSIIDTGVGLLGSSEAAFKIGNTNKENHSGFGMAIIQQAIENLGGCVSLSNIPTGGAKLDLRWGNF